MTRYGVPDDEMPDSILPPWWGPAPFDERDLDAVLSGEMTDIPAVLRPVVPTRSTDRPLRRSTCTGVNSGQIRCTDAIAVRSWAP